MKRVKGGLEWTITPGSVAAFAAGDHSSRTPVTRRLERPTRRSNGPDRSTAATSVASLLLGLAPGGVYLARRVTPPAGALLPHRFTLAKGQQIDKDSPPSGGLLSAALSLAFRPVGVTDHPVLWSPDFPPAAAALRQPQPATVQSTPRLPSRIAEFGSRVKTLWPGEMFAPVDFISRRRSTFPANCPAAQALH